MTILDVISRYVNRALAVVGGLFLVAMCLLTCGNILLRTVWVPIPGTFELMGFFGAVVAAFALGYTQIKRGHIAVDVLVNTFPPRVRVALGVINHAICSGFFAILAWQVARKAAILRNSGEVTETLRIIYYPFTYAVSLGCIVLTLVLAVDLVQEALKLKENIR